MGQLFSECKVAEPQVQSYQKYLLRQYRSDRKIRSASSSFLGVMCRGDVSDQTEQRKNIPDEEFVFCQQEAVLCFWTLRFIDFYDALKSSMNKGILQKNDILKAFSKNLNIELNSDHQKFVAAFEKKQQTAQAQESMNFNNFKPQYIPARKFFTSLILLGRDFPCDKAEQIFSLYDCNNKGFLTIQQFKELVDHLYFLILFALPATVDQQHDSYTIIQAIQREMLKNDHNERRIQKTIPFIKVIAQCIRTQIKTNADYIKAEMLRRCYGQKEPENKVKKVRFTFNTVSALQDDAISTKSEKRSTGYSIYESLAQQQHIVSSQTSSPTKKHLLISSNNLNNLEITVDEDNNGTREDSTTQSEDRHLKLLSQGKLNQFLLIESPTQFTSNEKNYNKKSIQQSFYQYNSHQNSDEFIKKRRSSTQESRAKQGKSLLEIQEEKLLNTNFKRQILIQDQRFSNLSQRHQYQEIDYQQLLTPYQIAVTDDQENYEVQIIQLE
ncbi:UNKNOWN [Stylonychia lemnae]|uniref:EF-hand domain-containing protein n=1 Tax=Stylonychia lemnae TaxID=5949 RepID=A0A078B713_STYLE|nr:UNKNOWN [Stylonychia lemnae]|eukprot:CDW89981.1 UNKNOWN [Stylonychia lemnae]